MVHKNVEEISFEKNDMYSIHIIEGKKMGTREEFFSEIALKLNFPDYFGKNFDALDECLCDLEWINFEIIKIIIKDFSLILNQENSKQKDIFISCLEDADEFWRINQSKTVDFYLQE